MEEVLNNRKRALRDRLSEIAIETLEKKGWKHEKAGRKSSVWRITKDGKDQQVSIRTSQNTWIAFPRNKDDDGWETLSQVNWVLAVSVDDRDWPKFANVHMIPADELRERFDRAYAARNALAARNPDRKEVALDRGMWLSLYHQESDDPVTHVGAGAGLKYPPIAQVPLEPTTETKTVSAGTDDSPLTIVEAKRRLAKYFGVDPACIKITVEA